MVGFRNYGPRRGGFNRPRWVLGEYMTPGILWLLIITTAIFFIEIVVVWQAREFYGFILTAFGLVPDGIFRGLRVWQPITYLFIHDASGVGHWFWNMLSLWMFGRDLERAWGTQKLIAFYFLTGVGAGLINALAQTIAAGGPPATITIGASGAIYGVLMACAILFPDRRIYLLLPPVEISMRWFVFIWGLLAFFGTILPGSGGVSHFTHLSGMAVAYLYLRRGSYFFRLRNSYSDWQRRRTARRFEVYKRRHQQEPPSRPDDWLN